VVDEIDIPVKLQTGDGDTQILLHHSLDDLGASDLVYNIQVWYFS
jgi:hypothetical protein